MILTELRVQGTTTVRNCPYIYGPYITLLGASRSLVTLGEHCFLRSCFCCRHDDRATSLPRPTDRPTAVTIPLIAPSPLPSKTDRQHYVISQGGIQSLSATPQSPMYSGDPLMPPRNFHTKPIRRSPLHIWATHPTRTPITEGTDSPARISL